jgi:hypothetical protein
MIERKPVRITGLPIYIQASWCGINFNKIIEYIHFIKTGLPVEIQSAELLGWAG